MTTLTYQLAGPRFSLVRDAVSDREKLLFHIKSGDYFATLATALGFVEEALADKDSVLTHPIEQALVRRLREELHYVDEHYDLYEKKGTWFGSRK